MIQVQRRNLSVRIEADQRRKRCAMSRSLTRTSKDGGELCKILPPRKSDVLQTLDTFRSNQSSADNKVSRWFAVTMGTGIVSILLHNLPYNGTWLYYVSVVVFCLNVALFILFLFISCTVHCTDKPVYTGVPTTGILVIPDRN